VLDLGQDSLAAHSFADLLLSEPFLTLAVLKDERRASLDLLADRCFGAGNLLSSWVLSDGDVGSLVQRLERFATESLLPLAELLLEGTWVVLLEQVVILLHMDAIDVFKMLLGREDGLRLLLLFLGTALLLADDNLRFLPTETGEAMIVMRHVEAAIAGTLHGAEDAVTGGRSHETDVEVCLEWASFVILIVDVVVLAIGSLLALEIGVDLFVLEEAAGEEETSGVGSGVVGQTALDAVVLELARVSGRHSHVTHDGRVDNRGDDAPVRESDDESVLLGVILVLVVDDESLAGVVVGLALSSSSELGLVPLRVCLVLQNFHKSHRNCI